VYTPTLTCPHAHQYTHAYVPTLMPTCPHAHAYVPTHKHMHTHHIHQLQWYCYSVLNSSVTIFYRPDLLHIVHYVVTVYSIYTHIVITTCTCCCICTYIVLYILHNYVYVVVFFHILFQVIQFLIAVKLIRCLLLLRVK